MSAGPDPIARASARRAAPGREALAGWLIVAGLNFLAQIALRRELAPGEFGTVNTVLGIVTVLAAPLLALDFFLAHRAATEAGRWRTWRAWVMDLAAPVWAVGALALLLVLLPFLALPRFSLDVLAVLGVGAALLAVVGRSRCATESRTRFWTVLVIAAATARFLASAGLAYFQPWAESGMAAVVVAGIITAVPAKWKRASQPVWAEVRAWVRDRAFRVPFLATASVITGLTLFTNADRIVAQANFGSTQGMDINFIDWRRFDDYQTAGLLARGLLWGTLPLLMAGLAERAPLERTSGRSLRFFWIYLGALFGGDLLLGGFAPFLSWVFTGDARGATRFLPGFVGAGFMLGLLQGVGVFALASRRHVECFVLGGCSLAYTLFLFLFGIEPQVMTSCIFGGALISLTAVLLVGIVRYARSHP